jgi:hypothetical protein
MEADFYKDPMLDVLERLDKDEMFREHCLRTADYLIDKASTITRLSVLQDALEAHPFAGLSGDDVRVLRENLSKGYLTLFERCLKEQDPESTLMQLGLMMFTGYLFNEQLEYDSTKEYAGMQEMNDEN